MRADVYAQLLVQKHGLKDSKQLTEKKREIWYSWLDQEMEMRKLYFTVALVSASEIDQTGIVSAIKKGIEDCFSCLAQHLDPMGPSKCTVFLDGGLHAPEQYGDQQTIIRGDESEPIISLASIAAKVTRDRHVVELAKVYPNYGFELHKGYGTSKHYESLRLHGLSPEHRKSFCKNIH